MASKYKVIGKATRTPTITIKTEMPVAALHLAEDMVALALIEQLIKSLDADSLTEVTSIEQRERAIEQIKSTLGLVRLWRRFAQIKMRHEFLTP
jgi:hypothetical protein